MKNLIVSIIVALLMLLGCGPEASASDRCSTPKASTSVSTTYATEMSRRVPARANAAALAERGWRGLQLDANDDDGAYIVTEVVLDSPADEAGFRPGDVLVAINGVPLTANDEFAEEVRTTQDTGSRVTFTVARYGELHQVSASLEPAPAAYRLQPPAKTKERAVKID